MTVIDTYLQNVDPPQHAELVRVRGIVKSVAPDAEEVISYGMPVLKVNGKYLIGFASFKNHMSIFPGAKAVETLGHKIDGYRLSRGTIQFTLDKPLPEAIIIAAVNLRLREITNQ